MSKVKAAAFSPTSVATWTPSESTSRWTEASQKLALRYAIAQSIGFRRRRSAHRLVSHQYQGVVLSLWMRLFDSARPIR